MIDGAKIAFRNQQTNKCGAWGGGETEKKTVVEKSGQNFVLTPCTEMDAEL